MPFNPSLGLFLSQFVFSIIEKKIKVNISYIVYRISYIGKTVSSLTNLPVSWLISCLIKESILGQCGDTMRRYTVSFPKSAPAFATFTGFSDLALRPCHVDWAISYRFSQENCLSVILSLNSFRWPSNKEGIQLFRYPLSILTL